MKGRILIFLFTLAFCISLSVFSEKTVSALMDEIEKEAVSVQELIKKRDIDKALNKSNAIESRMKDAEGLLESLLPHTDIHELSAEIADVRVSLQINDLDDSEKAIELFIKCAGHLKRHESLSFGNLF